MKTTSKIFDKLWIWVIIVLIIPMIVYLIIYIPNPSNEASKGLWLGFFGGYLGAGIGVLMTLYVMRKTSIENKENVIIALEQDYRQKQLDDLKVQLASDIKVIDVQSLVIARNLMQKNPWEAHNLLLSLNKNVEFQPQISELYIASHESKEHRAYDEAFNNLVKEYGKQINGLLLFTSLYITFRKEPSASELTAFVKEKKTNNVSEPLNTNSETIISLMEIYNKILDIKEGEGIGEKLEVIISDVLNLQKITELKQERRNAILALVNSEEEKLKNILNP